MIPRYPALSVELRSEADDLRRYAREFEAAGDAAGASAVRDQSMHVQYDVELRPVFPASSCVDVAEVPAAGKRALASFVGPLGEVRRMVEAAAARGVA